MRRERNRFVVQADFQQSKEKLVRISFIHSINLFLERENEKKQTIFFFIFDVFWRALALQVRNAHAQKNGRKLPDGNIRAKKKIRHA